MEAPCFVHPDQDTRTFTGRGSMVSLLRTSHGMHALGFLFAASAHAQPAASTSPAERAVRASSPSLAPIAARSAQVGDSVRIPVVVDDVPPGAVVELRMDGAPAGARLDAGVIRWRPLRTDAGSSYAIVVRAMIGGAEAARGTAQVSVTDAHRMPVLRRPADRVVPAGDSLSIPLDVGDPDGDELTIAVTNVSDVALPPRYDARTRTLEWQAPRSMANRTFLWRVTASDGDGGSASTELHVSVRSQNVAPVCGPLRTFRRDEGERVEIPLDAEDANGDSLSYQPLITLPNAVVRGAVYDWSIPFGFVLPTRQDSTVRLEWKATDPARASTTSSCVALVTVFRSIAEGPFRARQAQHRQLLADVRSELTNFATRERATRDSLAATSTKRRAVKRASLVSALVGGLLQIARSEETRRIAAGVSATLTVGLSGWESTIEEAGPLSNRAEAIAQQRVTLARALSRFLRRYGETVSRDSLLGPTYDADHLELFDLLAATGRAATTAPPAADAQGATGQ
jgi:hypothetical protein